MNTNIMFYVLGMALIGVLSLYFILLLINVTGFFTRRLMKKPTLISDFGNNILTGTVVIMIIISCFMFYLFIFN